MEAEISKSLSFIPGKIFRHFSFIVNGAWMKSATVQRDITISGLIIDSAHVKGRPLQGQSPYVFNGGLYYENAGWGTKIGLTYNVSGSRIYAKSSVNAASKGQDTIAVQSTRPDLLELPRHLLDFSFSQRIVRSLQLKFSIQNLLDQSFRIVEDQNYNQKYDPEKPFEYTLNGPGNGEYYYRGDNIYRRYKPGRYFILQLTYAF